MLRDLLVYMQETMHVTTTIDGLRLAGSVSSAKAVNVCLDSAG